jgi:selenide,water dikinase
VPRDVQDVLFDPQTSGGLLIFVQPSAAGELLDALRSEKIEAAEIGAATALSEHLLTVS